MSQPDFNSAVYRSLKAALETNFVVSEQYSDSKSGSVVIRPTGIHTPTYEGMNIKLTSLVNLFIYKTCDISLIWRNWKVVGIDEDYKRVSAELEASGTIEYIKYTIEYIDTFNVENICAVC